MKVLVIEDDVEIAHVLKKGLGTYRCLVEIAYTGKQGIACAQFNEYDAIILDLHLGDMQGADVARSIRICKPSIPILVLSVETYTATKVSLLSFCDDYLTKPFVLDEVMARLRALCRRGSIVQDSVVIVGPLMLDSVRYEVKLDGVHIHFRNKEFALLEYLMRHRDIILSRETILSHVWDMNADPFTNTVDTHIRLLRKKLETPERIFIHTIPKRGYRFSFS